MAQEILNDDIETGLFNVSCKPQHTEHPNHQQKEIFHETAPTSSKVCSVLENERDDEPPIIIKNVNNGEFNKEKALSISKNTGNDKEEDDVSVPPPLTEPIRRPQLTSFSSPVSSKSVRFLNCCSDNSFDVDNYKDKDLQEAVTTLTAGTTIHSTDAINTDVTTTAAEQNSKKMSMLRKLSSFSISSGDDSSDFDSYIHTENAPELKSEQSNVSTLSTQLFHGIDNVSTRAFNKLFGDSYSKKECVFVLLAGALIAFNMGFVNGSCLSGLLTPTHPTQTQNVSGFTSSYTRSALALADGDYETFGYHICLILSYMMGSFLCGSITPNATPYQIEPTYGPTFMIGGIMLMIASFFAALEWEPRYIFFLTAGANGIQNGIASLYSANLIRCSLTGSSTDVALIIGQCLRGNRGKIWRGLVLLGILINFWLGGLLSFYFTRRFLSYTLFFNAVLFWIIGLGLVYFLVHELQISLRAAVLGTYEWKKAFESLSQSIKSQYGDSVGYGYPDESNLYNMFDIIDDDGNGEIGPEELLDALLQANVKINAKGVMVLIKSADANGDGMINRDDWLKIVRKIESS